MFALFLPLLMRSAETGWWMTEPIRWVQTNLRETDAALSSDALSDDTRRHTVWAAFCQALLASNEFRYLD